MRPDQVPIGRTEVPVRDADGIPDEDTVLGSHWIWGMQPLVDVWLLFADQAGKCGLRPSFLDRCLESRHGAIGRFHAAIL